MLPYLAGLFTIPLLVAATVAWLHFQDWLDDRRYRRAWDKFGAEFAELTPGQLEFWQKAWAKDAFQMRRPDDRSRYFAMRWDNGMTNEA